MGVKSLEHGDDGLLDEGVGVDIVDIETLDEGLGIAQLLVGGELHAQVAQVAGGGAEGGEGDE